MSITVRYHAYDVSTVLYERLMIFLCCWHTWPFGQIIMLQKRPWNENFVSLNLGWFLKKIFQQWQPDSVDLRVKITSESRKSVSCKPKLRLSYNEQCLSDLCTHFNSAKALCYLDWISLRWTYLILTIYYNFVVFRC